MKMDPEAVMLIRICHKEDDRIFDNSVQCLRGDGSWHFTDTLANLVSESVHAASPSPMCAALVLARALADALEMIAASDCTDTMNKMEELVREWIDEK